ncbi:hypothetical protein LMK05_07420 [Lactococcus petauri]|nr:hypothetical protein LMK05_07420 [Lactococcus petauri]
MKPLIIGSALVDIILDVPHLPGRGTDLTCLRERTVIGGCGYNIASVFSYMEVECA